MKGLLKIFLIISINLLSGCTKIIVSNQMTPIAINDNGTFVSETEFVDLVNGGKIKQRKSGNVNDYYLPGNLIKIENGYVTLFKKALY